MRRTRVPGLVVPLVLLLALAGVGGVLVLGKDVTLVVDERARAVDTFAGTVADLLAQQGVTVDEHDEVQPALDAALSDGMQVHVALAKEITLLLNGDRRTLYVTGDRVQDVLQQINVRAKDNAYLEPSRGARLEDGDTVVYKEAVDVQVRVDGQTRNVITNADDVGFLLDSLGIVLRRLDEVTPSASTPLEAGMEVRVVRVDVREVTEDEAIPHGTEVQQSNEYLQGTRRVVRAGQPGLRRTRYEVRLEDGKEVARTSLGSEVVREPVDEVVVEGTRPPQTQSGVASWYHRSGMVAAHQTLPFGTQVRVTNLANGRSVTVVINDRGPFIGGRVIDLSDDAYAQISPLGSGTINVRLTW